MQRFGRFEMGERLGRGGYGEVFRARDVRLGRDVALKLVPIPEEDREATRARILREARAAAAIHHPNVVAVFDAGDDGETAYIAMEYVRGKTLRHYIGRDDIPLDTRVRWLIDIARALEAAHARGIVHRDVKPENVMITEEGVVKVLDFGIARPALNIDRAAVTQTLDPIAPDVVPIADSVARGEVRGTPEYMAPEQLRGERLDGRADQFAWGVVAFELLSGERPWTDPVLNRLIARILTDSHGALPAKIPQPLKETIYRALSKRSSDRFEAMRDLLAAMRATSAQRGGRWRALTSKWALLSMVIAICWVVVLPVWRVRSTVVRTPATARTVASPARNPEAVSAYVAGMQAMHDGARSAAIANYDRATQLDPTFAESHLWWTITHAFLDDDGRGHFAAATKYRASMAEKDKVLLDAIEPWTRIPPDKSEMDRRLSLAAEQYPDDSEFPFLIGKYKYLTVSDQEAIAAETEALRLEPTFGYALYIRSLSHLRLGNTDAALRDLRGCINVSPAATACLSVIRILYENEGFCAEAEATTRKLIALDPSSQEWYSALGRDLYGAGGSFEAAQLALDQAHRRMAAAPAAVATLQDAANLAVVDGNYDQAAGLAENWFAVVEGRSNDDDHQVPTIFLADLLFATGQRTSALKVLETYLRRTHGWTHDTFDIDQSIVVVQRKYLSDGMTREQYLRFRDTWLLHENDRVGSERPATWAIAYTGACRNRDDAREAIGVLPQYGMPDALTRTTAWDYRIGTMYSLAGDVTRGLSFLRRAARSCLAIATPLTHTIATFHLAEQLELDGAHQEACEAYAVVAERWGKPGTRFTLGVTASARLRALHCPEHP